MLYSTILASPTLQGICPVQALEGTTPDISFLLHFSFYEPVYYRIDSSEPDLNIPSSSNEKTGYWVGFADNQGDSLTWRILTEDTQKIVIRSGVRSALRTTTNQRLASPSGQGTTLPFPIPYPQQSQNSLPLDPLDVSTPNFEQFVKSQSGEDEDNPIPMANIDIPNHLGRSFLLPPEDNGERHMAKIIEIDDHGQTLENIKFKLKINKDQAEEIMSYNQLMDYIQKGTDAEEDPDSLFKFRDIVAHQGPLESTDPNHKGSKYNVMVEWESGEVTYEPLTLISKDDPITCAVYAKKHDLLDTTGWKHLKRYSVPLLIKDGLAYATSLGKPTDQDMDTYPHVFFTSPDEWDPSVLDNDPPHLDGLDPSQVPDQPFGDPMFDAYGDFNERIITNLNILLDAPPEDCGSYIEISSVLTANLHHSSPQEPDWNALRPFFAWTSPSSIKDTFNVTTRHGTAPHTQDYIKKHFKSRNPVFNIPRCSEAVATDTIFSDTPAVDDPWPNSSVAVILLSVMPMASNPPNNSSTLSLTTSENGEPWMSSSVMEANMKSLSESLISSVPYSSKIISLNPIINTKARLKIVLDLPSDTPTLS